MTTGKSLFFILLLIILAGSCSSTQSSKQEMQENDNNTMQTITFSGDSAYDFVKTQCDFGPRVPNTDAHRLCGDFLIGKLKEYGANVIVQAPVLTAYDGTKLNARNIIGEFSPEK